MNARGFESETAPPPGDGTPERRGEGDARLAMRAAPPDKEDEGQRAEEPADEPGYGHGV